jgi:NAD(P)H-hydrate epimerase
LGKKRGELQMAERVLTAKEMQAADAWAIQELGIPSLALMESAGRAVFDCVGRYYPSASRILVVTGKGNNGGDGYVVARLLHRAGWGVRLWSAFDAGSLRGDAAVNGHRAAEAGVRHAGKAGALDALDAALAASDLVVDAVFGTGLRGAPRGIGAGTIAAINRSGLPVIAVDGPSGISGDTGKAEGECVRAARTVVIAHWKVGHLLYPGRAFCGELDVVDIGIPEPPLAGGADARNRYRVVEEDLRARWPHRAVDCHKGQVGRLLVIAGSRGMAGAACLAAEAAMRAGAGYVVLAAPEGIVDVLAAKLLEVVLRPLPENEQGRISAAALPQVLEFAQRADALAIGPGLGPEAAGFLRAFLAQRPQRPCVFDADALVEVGRHDGGLGAQVVVTPHAGELGRMLGGVERTEIERAPLHWVETARQRLKSNVLLKGSPTLVATTKGNTLFVDEGHPGMASAGSGDVLTGVIGALLAAGIPAADAGWMGAWLHGRAGRLAAREWGVGLLARDLRDGVPVVLRELMEGVT